MANWHIGNDISTTTRMLCYAMVTLLFLPHTNPQSFSYNSFAKGDLQLKLEGDAEVSRSEIRVTLSSVGQSNSYSVGRVTRLQKMHLWDMNSRKLTDFTTKFSFVVFSNDNPYGDGLAFFLADPMLPLLTDIVEGGGLGLVDGKQVLNSTPYSFVAVEFDTFKNSWDPDNPHVGVNFNSMMSNITAPWLIDMPANKVYDCSIDYNSSTYNLRVSFTGYHDSTGAVVENSISYKVDLRDHLPEWVMFGFSAATGSSFEVHVLKSWSFSSSLQLSDATGGNKLAVGLGIGIGLFVILLVLAGFLLWKRTRGITEEVLECDLNMDDEFQKGIGPKRFCYNELESATSKFSESEKLGQGGFGDVYKGFLKDLNSYVAIKRISKESRQGIKEYATEVKIISQLRHKNLVQLLGWCHKKNDLILVYEFMTNGSLDSHLYGGKGFLTWPVRYNIALGLASAMLYLQEEWEQCVLHRDIKSSNIMLDSSFNAKLGDFGLARLVDHEKGSQTTLIAGTKGYIAPEYVITGKAYKESDIYSFGIVLLEIASGRKPVDLKAKEGQITIVEWVWELYELGELFKVADPRLCGAFDEEQMERLAVIGLWCAFPNYRIRPSMMQVIQVLKFEAQLPILPKWMPVTTCYPLTITTFSSV
ncbi:L-type lectin-domain containing receptor kinase IX.1-like [Abrus precatorius]|uniref:non-specific serine/threonine protein kinase n=1 Tax=Abrus precatorius TaxID=3816 RepID=A0A8B8K434_ABRPR|nr:L-type lectin-domain containing receptor kinase IX.1-like [Abrus precatorius]